MKRVKVEYFYTEGCSRCVAARQVLRDAALSLGGVEWEEIDLALAPARAVDAGVIGTPAVVIGAERAFDTAPTSAQLKAAIESRMRGA